eukprot:gene13538-18159_t
MHLNIISNIVTEWLPTRMVENSHFAIDAPYRRLTSLEENTECKSRRSSDHRYNNDIDLNLNIIQTGDTSTLTFHHSEEIKEYKFVRKPSSKPTYLPTIKPPSFRPTRFPTVIPSLTPSTIPSNNPTLLSTFISSSPSTTNPSIIPSSIPSSNTPTFLPTTTPSPKPSSSLTYNPSSVPSYTPSSLPSLIPTIALSNNPSISPSAKTTSTSTTAKTFMPSFIPPPFPTYSPNATQTSSTPTTNTLFAPQPTFEPTITATLVPSYPSFIPTSTLVPSYPSFIPTCIPTFDPTLSLPQCQQQQFAKSIGGYTDTMFRIPQNIAMSIQWDVFIAVYDPSYYFCFAQLYAGTMPGMMIKWQYRSRNQEEKYLLFSKYNNTFVALDGNINEDIGRWSTWRIDFLLDNDGTHGGYVKVFRNDVLLGGLIGPNAPNQETHYWKQGIYTQPPSTCNVSLNFRLSQFSSTVPVRTRGIN